MSPPLYYRKTRVGAVAPVYATSGSAGLDLTMAAWRYPDSDEIMFDRLLLAPGDRALVLTGIEVEIPEGYEGQVRPRSGLALRHGITCLNSPGTIDSDYRGEVGVLLVHVGQEGDDLAEVHPGDRVAQFVVAPVQRFEVVEREVLSETVRGSGGYGHTGRGEIVRTLDGLVIKHG